MRKCLLLVSILTLLWTTPGWVAAAGDAADEVSQGPLEVTATRLDVDEQQGTAVFSGEVVAKRGDMTLYAETLTIYRVGQTDQIDRIEASGGVRIVQQDRVGTSQRAVFHQQEERLVLSGNAMIQQGQNQVAGDEIVLFTRENRSLVKSGEDGRVRAVFFPEQERK